MPMHNTTMMICARPFRLMLTNVDEWRLASQTILSGSALRLPRSYW